MFLVCSPFGVDSQEFLPFWLPCKALSKTIPFYYGLLEATGGLFLLQRMIYLLFFCSNLGYKVGQAPVSCSTRHGFSLICPLATGLTNSALCASLISHTLRTLYAEQSQMEFVISCFSQVNSVEHTETRFWQVDLQSLLGIISFEVVSCIICF